MIWFPSAKINLGLHVIRKRTDGYHDINTCFFPVPWTDILEIIPSQEFEFTSSGLEIPVNAENNLCVKAYNMLHADYEIPPVKIHLHKIIPMGAGLGGGSSDATYTIKGLNELFELNLSLEQQHEYAQKLGSDCAFFLYNEPMIAEGRGEILTPIEVPVDDLKLVIVYPEIHVDTSKAFSMLKPKEERPPIHDILQKDAGFWRYQLLNDFEKIIFQQHPQIRAVKEELYELGAIYASMSGTGSAVYGFFRTIPEELKDVFTHHRVFKF